MDVCEKLSDRKFFKIHDNNDDDDRELLMYKIRRRKNIARAV